MIDLLESQAREKAGMPPTWLAYRWACMPPGHPETLYYEVEGIVTTATYKSGPRKGRPNYDAGDQSTERTVIISAAEHAEYVARWERETGKCAACNGSGKEIASCGVDIETTYRPCRKCKGTGRPATTRGEGA